MMAAATVPFDSPVAIELLVDVWSPTHVPGVPMPTALTVVLVHGAFAESASWSGVIARLADRGVAVVATPNPLRSVSTDAANVRSAVDGIGGPVLLVGHSYGGAVIT